MPSAIHIWLISLRSPSSILPFVYSAAVALPHPKLGECVGVVAIPHEGGGKVTPEDVIKAAAKSLPKVKATRPRVSGARKDLPLTFHPTISVALSFPLSSFS